MNQITKFSLGLFLTGIAYSGCSPRGAITEREQEIQAINLNYMDSSIRPQDDFFQFVNGGWLDKTDIPADQGRWGSFNELREFNNDAVLRVLQRAADSDEYQAGSDERKAADFL